MSQSFSAAIDALKAALGASQTTSRLVAKALLALPTANQPSMTAAIAEIDAACATVVAITAELTAALGVASAPLPITPAPLSLAVTVRAADVVDRIGVCTHNNYNDGQYRDTAKVIEAMSFLGVQHFRDTNFRPEDQGQDALRNVVRAGMKITAYLRGDSTPAQSVERFREFARLGCLAMMEGFNEINNEPIAGGEVAAQRFMEEFYLLARADSLLKDIPIAGFTNYPASYSCGDVDSIHPYAKRGAQPSATIESDLAMQREANRKAGALAPDKPFIITETGYHTAPKPSAEWETVNEETQAKLVLNTICAAWRLGALRVFLYQLFDAYPGEGVQEHFGLFRLDYTPKPSALAIASFVGLLHDEGPDAETFAPAPLAVTVSDAPPNGASFVVQKSAGEYAVVTWAEGDCWDEDADKPLAAPVTRQTIHFGRAFANVAVYDPLQSGALATAQDAASIVVSVSDHPIVIILSD